MSIDHPNEPGKWTQLSTLSYASLWRRERADPIPVTQFYLLAPPRQTQIFYNEGEARGRFEALSSVGASPAQAEDEV